MAQPTKISVFSENTFRELGFVPCRHPNGYIYFMKKSDGDAGSCGVVPPVQVQPDEVDSVETQKNSLMEELPEQHVDVHGQCSKSGNVVGINPDYRALWRKELGSQGYTRCLFAECNFICHSYQKIVKHHLSCKGGSVVCRNTCKRCGSPMDPHAQTCQGKDCKFKNLQNKSLTTLSKNNNGPNRSEASVISSSTSSKPAQSRKIVKTNDSSGEPIIQPLPQVLKGTYLRRRPHNAVHVESWERKIKEDKYISCHFQNCRFIALSVEDMCAHFGLCSGNSSFAQFECRFCLGVVTSQHFLDIHIASSHEKDLRAENNCKSSRDLREIKNEQSAFEENNKSISKKDNEFQRLLVAGSESYTPEITWERCETLLTPRLRKAIRIPPPIIVESYLNVAVESEIPKVEIGWIVGHKNSVQISSTQVERAKVSGKCNEILDTGIRNGGGAGDNHSLQTRLVNPWPNQSYGKEGLFRANQGLTLPSSYEEARDEKLCEITSNEMENRSCLELLAEVASSKTHSNNEESAQNLKNVGKASLEDPSVEISENVEERLEENLPFIQVEEKSIRKTMTEESKISCDSEGGEVEDTVRKKGLTNQNIERINDLPEIEDHSKQVSEEILTSNSNLSDDEKLSVIKAAIKSSSKDAVSDCNRDSCENPEEEQSVVLTSEKSKKHGRKRCRPLSPVIKSTKKEQSLVKKGKHCRSNMVACGKCETLLKINNWDFHNAVEHAGLGWKSDETPFSLDVEDSQSVLVRVRNAFKICKSARCEICGRIMKSFLGFHSHIMICGKSGEEREEALKKCTVCKKRVMPYSMATHMKIHQEETAQAQIVSLPESNILQPPKRRSALRALSLLQKEMNTAEDNTCIVYKKGDAIPVNHFEKIRTLDTEKVRCRVPDCPSIFDKNGAAALDHFFNCPLLPQKFYCCINCDFYSVKKSESAVHKCGLKRTKTSQEKMREGINSGSEGESSHEFFDEKEIDGEYSPRTPSPTSSTDDEDCSERNKVTAGRLKRFKITHSLSPGERLLMNSCVAREDLKSDDSLTIHQRTFEMELARQESYDDTRELFPQLHTKASDWHTLEPYALVRYLPPLSASLPVQYSNIENRVTDFKNLPLFGASDDRDFVAGFAGGPIQTLAWCPVSINRSRNSHQYLALSVSSQVEDYPKLVDNSSGTALIQIWDVGCIENMTSMKMVLGIATDFGEIWDLVWSPNDVWNAGSGSFLPRIGLVAVAGHDGVVRIFSISLPTNSHCPPIYKVLPVAKLLLIGDSVDDPCLRVSWADGGVICAGYRSGFIAIWNLNSINVEAIAGTYSLLPVRKFKANDYPITSVALCPSHPSQVVTGASDRKIIFWDTRKTVMSTRSEYGAPQPCLRWARHWPVVFSKLDDTDVGYFLSPCFHHTSLVLKTTSAIKDSSLCNWSLMEAFGTSSGELIIRRYHDIFDRNQLYKDRNKTMIVARVKTTNYHGYASYAEAEEEKVGVQFKDCVEGLNSLKKEKCNAFGAFTLTAAEKVSINPNYGTFNYIAVGYRFGVFRIIRLTDMDMDRAKKKINKSNR